MQVTSYQMRNVIDCFCKKLSQTRKQEKPENPLSPKMTGEMALMPEGSRKATMDKISEQVLHKINEAGGLTRPPAQPSEALFDGNGTADDAGAHAETSFTFNVIDAIDQKRTATLAVGNATALIKRLDQLARAQGSTKTESWG
ncbi:MAG: hypothetical protein E4H48_00590 [Syntrophobacterales bacterium]|nr:MAG: hypothetical protein E4H48_00590 [Syntrophobacterales bacterium]